MDGAALGAHKDISRSIFAIWQALLTGGVRLSSVQLRIAKLHMAVRQILL